LSFGLVLKGEVEEKHVRPRDVLHFGHLTKNKI